MNLDRIEAVLRLLHRQGHVGSISIDGGAWRLNARKGRLPPVEEQSELSLADDQVIEAERLSIRSLQVGIYRAPTTALRRGDFVARGAAVGHLDSMRILTPILSDAAGYVIEAHVEDGDPVEYGQELFVLTSEMPAHPEEPDRGER